MSITTNKLLKAGVLGGSAALVLSGCGFSPYSLPLPGGADLGSHPYTVTVHFRDVLDLVPQSAVRVNDVAVGKVTDIKLDGWTAVVKVKINDTAKLPDNAEASIRQTSLLGEKFVSLNAPTSGASGRLGNGDVIPLTRSGRNPEIEEVLGAASLLFNGGGLDKTRTIVQELNKTLEGNEPQVRELLSTADTFISQLDANKAQILTALEKVNNLAVQTNKQKSAITGALDELPDALRVVNQQRDDLVTLLKALNHLGDVGTSVIKESKVDTIADLKALGPVLEQLANSGDDLAKSLTALLTFPFPDGSVGGQTVQGAKDFQQGDYFNLAIEKLDLSRLLNAPSKSVAPQTTGIPELGETPGAQDPLSDLGPLSDLVGELVPQLGTLTGSSPTPTSSTPSPQSDGSSSPVLPRLCELLGSCRVAAASSTPVADTDLARLLLEPVVVK